MDFTKLKQREIKTPKMILRLEIELLESTLTLQESINRLTYLLNSSESKAFSEFLVFLLRETKSSMWELKNLEIDEIKEK